MPQPGSVRKEGRARPNGRRLTAPPNPFERRAEGRSVSLQTDARPLDTERRFIIHTRRMSVFNAESALAPRFNQRGRRP